MTIDFAAFLKTLPIMGYGMVGIFIVMLVIYALVAIFSKLSAGKGES